MYSTCLYCTRDLDTNEVLETLPIGRRVAFDAHKGRLWVVCRKCAKWNLVPFDTRLETIDACEQLYRDTAKRYATDNIGLARVREGLELVRIGEPMRPEFAAWRYGDQFSRRRKRNILIAASVGTVGIAVVSGASALGVGLGSLYQIPNMYNIFVMNKRVVVRVPREGESPLELSPILCSQTKLVESLESETGWAVKTKVLEGGKRIRRLKKISKKEQLITGPHAQELLAKVLGLTNHWLGTRRQIGDAVQKVEDAGGPERLLQEGINHEKTRSVGKVLRKLPAAWRLATEMALHEESERVALDGELKLLEWQWREAERLAKISDDLVTGDIGAPIG